MYDDLWVVFFSSTQLLSDKLLTMVVFSHVCNILNKLKTYGFSLFTPKQSPSCTFKNGIFPPLFINPGESPGAHSEKGNH